MLPCRLRSEKKLIKCNRCGMRWSTFMKSPIANRSAFTNNSFKRVVQRRAQLAAHVQLAIPLSASNNCVTKTTPSRTRLFLPFLEPIAQLLLHALRVRETSVDIVMLGGFVLSRSCAIGTRKGKKSRVLERVVLSTQLFDALKGIANRTCAASCARRRATRLKELFV